MDCESKKLPFKEPRNEIVGATNTTKNLIQRMLMQSALKSIGTGRDRRALAFDVKQDVLSTLAGMSLSCRIKTLDPFDRRGYAWDMAADSTPRPES